MMRRLLALSLLAVPLLGACHQQTQAGAVREAYDNKADAIDQQADQQPTPVARELYHDHADAIREEGKDRQKGLEGKTPSAGADTSGMPQQPPPPQPQPPQ
jgi:hypothetical protein